MLFLPLPWVDWPLCCFFFPSLLLFWSSVVASVATCFPVFLLPNSCECWLSISGGGAPFLSALTTGTEPWKPRTCCWVAKLHQCFPLSSSLLHLGLPTFFPTPSAWRGLEIASHTLFQHLSPRKERLAKPVCKQNMEATRNWAVTHTWLVLSWTLNRNPEVKTHTHR